MSAITPVDFVASQLRQASPGVDWVMEIDRARELAQIFVDLGVVDVSRLLLKIIPHKETVPVYTVTEAGTEIAAYAEKVWNTFDFVYMGRSIPFLHGDKTGEFGPDWDHRVFRWSAEGKGHIDFKIAFRSPDNSFYLKPVWESSSDAADIRQAIVVIVMAVVTMFLPAAGVSLSNIVGTTIIGAEMAAAYPGLATVVGNVAVGTALSGGDIEGAVKGAVLAYFGQIGATWVQANVTNMTGVELIGKVAASGARAIIQGGDLEKAVAFSLATNGASAVQEYFDTPVSVDPSQISVSEIALTDDDWAPIEEWEAEVSFGDDLGLFAPNPYDVADPVWVGDPATPDVGVPAWDPYPIPEVTYNDPGLFPSDSATPPTTPYYPIPEVTITPGGATPPGSSWSLKDITAAALATLQIVKAYNDMGGQAQNPTTSNRAANPATGMITTKSPNGQTTSGKPAVGVATITPDGGVIVNNGNGTYDYVSPQGQRSTRSYTAQPGQPLTGPNGQPTSGGMFGLDQKTLLMGGAAVALFMIMKK